MDWCLERVDSGGQSGADRAGLEIGRALGYRTGGVAPKGYRTEYGPDLALRDVFGLTESASSIYTVRTLLNVQHADATVVFGDVTSQGTRQTLQNCRVWGKPHCENPSPEALRRFLIEHRVTILNIAGNRHSRNPRVFDHAILVLCLALLRPGQRLLTPREIPTNPHAMYTLPSPEGRAL